MIGESIRQGPHQGAQQSTTTMSFFETNSSKVASERLVGLPSGVVIAGVSSWPTCASYAYKGSVVPSDEAGRFPQRGSGLKRLRGPAGKDRARRTASNQRKTV